jgi:hypothetical protein
MTSSLMGLMTWRWYHKHPSNRSSKSGKGGGRSALLCKGTVLKDGKDKLDRPRK